MKTKNTKFPLTTYKYNACSVEPAQTGWFYVEISDELSIESHLITSIDLPKMTMNLEKSEPIKWGVMKIKIMEILEKPITPRIVYWAESCNTIGRQITIMQLNGAMEEIHGWKLEGCKLLNVDFGNCDYAQNGIQYIELVIQPQSCSLIMPSKKSTGTKK